MKKKEVGLRPPAPTAPRSVSAPDQMLTSALFARLREMDETEWIEYIDKYVLVKDVVGPGRWSVGDASQGSSRPGATTSTAGQAIESWWAGLKRILPVNIGLMSCSNATHELEKALKAKYTQARAKELYAFRNFDILSFENVERIYILPCKDPAMAVIQVCIALEALGCWHHDAARLSLGALKHTLHAVAETSAKIASARTKGTSGHRDPQLPLQRLRHFTTKILPESVESMRPSTGRPVNVARGSSSAWRSREDMEARASETTRRRRAQAQALDAPQKKSGQSSAQLAARPSSDRSVRLAEATKGLRSTSFTKHVEGFHVVQELQTTPAEAKTHGLGVLFAKMTKVDDLDLSLPIPARSERSNSEASTVCPPNMTSTCCVEDIETPFSRTVTWASSYSAADSVSDFEEEELPCLGALVGRSATWADTSMEAEDHPAPAGRSATWAHGSTRQFGNIKWQVVFTQSGKCLLLDDFSDGLRQSWEVGADALPQPVVKRPPGFNSRRLLIVCGTWTQAGPPWLWADQTSGREPLTVPVMAWRLTGILEICLIQYLLASKRLA
ncbi:zfp36l2 [Symbiodinium microadriaticum]|nr:zfp36l2 [Symbiodinium microadriaticum]CAE7913388.1 zfp36l2 [Symbiodinium sp. KB8]